MLLFKKKYLLLLIVSFLYIVWYSNSFAWDYDSQINKCLNKLKEEVQRQYHVDISSISVDGVDADLSVYTWSANSIWQKVFSEVLKENFSTKWCQYALWYSKDKCKKYFSHVFFAKRNNISTVKITPEIKWKWYWTMTEFVTWWWDTAFEFPLQKWTDPQFEDYSYYSEWDRYGLFKQNLVYVQYLLDWTLLSCWYIRLLADNLDNINQNNYMGNKFESWWFKKLNTWNIDWDKFFGMKVLVKGLDWNNNDLFNLNLIAIAYDNNSPFFNEYISYPLQIKAMNDVTLMASENHTMTNVIGKYQDYLLKNTCFKLVHESESDLPSFCWWKFKSKSDLVSYVPKESLLTYLKKIFINNVYALDMPEDAKEKARKVLNSEVVTRNWIKITTREKINSLKDEKLKSWLIYVLSPGSRALINKKEEKWVYVPYNERIYKKCPLNHTQIAENIEYIFKKYYKDWILNLENAKYLNPEFWDCIIPYPDVRHKNKLIENSFLENKIAFIKQKFWDKKVEEYEEKTNKITSSYIKKINSLKKKYQEKLFEGDKNWAELIKKEINKVYDDMEENINNVIKNDKNLAKYIELKKEAFKDISSKDLVKSKKHANTYLVFIIIWIILLVLWTFLIYNKNKNA